MNSVVVLIGQLAIIPFNKIPIVLFELNKFLLFANANANHRIYSFD